MDEESLPEGLTQHRLAKSDARAVYELMAADQLVHLGRVELDEADIVADWQRPSFDVAAQVVGVFDGERLVGYAEAGERGDAAVHPDYLGRGIGTWLARRMQGMGRDLGLKTVGMPVIQGSPGDRLLDSLGYRLRWTSWVLQLPEGERIPERRLPDGYAVREASTDDGERRDVHAVLEDAFLEWADRAREPFEDFAAGVLGRPGFESWNLRVVTEPGGRIVAACVVTLSAEERVPEAYVMRIATRSSHRNRGLAQALLADTFAAARDRGAVVCSLSTDSRTGALALYDRVGMRVVDTWVDRAIDL